MTWYCNINNNNNNRTKVVTIRSVCPRYTHQLSAVPKYM